MNHSKFILNEAPHEKMFFIVDSRVRRDDPIFIEMGRYSKDVCFALAVYASSEAGVFS